MFVFPVLVFVLTLLSCSFLQFAWARSRLPANISDGKGEVDRSFRMLVIIQENKGDEYLPTSGKNRIGCCDGGADKWCRDVFFQSEDYQIILGGGVFRAWFPCAAPN